MVENGDQRRQFIIPDNLSAGDRAKVKEHLLNKEPTIKEFLPVMPGGLPDDLTRDLKISQSIIKKLDLPPGIDIQCFFNSIREYLKKEMIVFSYGDLPDSVSRHRIWLIEKYGGFNTGANTFFSNDALKSNEIGNVASCADLLLERLNSWISIEKDKINKQLGNLLFAINTGQPASEEQIKKIREKFNRDIKPVSQHEFLQSASSLQSKLKHINKIEENTLEARNKISEFLYAQKIIYLGYRENEPQRFEEQKKLIQQELAPLLVQVYRLAASVFAESATA